jgi:exonuclease III
VLLVTWNVAGRVRRRAEQAEALIALDADAVALQEVTPTTLAGWRADLDAAGYAAVSSLDRLRERPGGRRPLGVLIAARGGLEEAAAADVPWPERVAAARLPGPPALELHNLHSPISPSPGLAKVLTHEAVHRRLSRPADVARVLCGDLNTPRRESLGGETTTFARTSAGRLRPERGERWDRAELALVRGLEPAGFRDAFRSLHGWEPRDRSWTWPNGGGYRLDHVIVSARVGVRRCEYLHAWREAGLSDHSAMTAELEL